MFFLLQPRFSLDFSPGQLDSALRNRHFQNKSQKYEVLPLTPSGVKDVMSKHPQEVTAMIPEGFWVINNEPFQPMTSNYDIITRDASVYITMTTEDGLLAVSYGTSVRVKIGFRYRVDYYVQPKYANDQELFVSHLMEHFDQVKQLHNGRNVSFSMWYPENVSRTGIVIKKSIATKLDLHTEHTPEYPTLLLSRGLIQHTKKNSRL